MRGVYLRRSLAWISCPSKEAEDYSTMHYVVLKWLSPLLIISAIGLPGSGPGEWYTLVERTGTGQ